MSLLATQTVSETAQPIKLVGRGKLQREPIRRNGALDKFKHFESTPTIGEEFPDLQVDELLAAENADELLKDLAVLTQERGVVFFRNQEKLTLQQQLDLVDRLGKLTGKPKESTLHIHPVTEPGQPEGETIRVITSEDFQKFRRVREAESNGSKQAISFGAPAKPKRSANWHTDITFEPVPSDFALLKIHTLPPSGGGDTLWSSAYTAYERLSPALQQFLEGLHALHSGEIFKKSIHLYGYGLTSKERGHPENQGEDLLAVHPIVRTNPVTGWKGLFVNPGFTKRIVELDQDESDAILQLLFRAILENHDADVRFRWNKNDVALWSNTSTYHTATFDYGLEKRVGDRALSIGEKPYFDPASVSRSQGLAARASDR